MLAVEELELELEVDLEKGLKAASLEAARRRAAA